ncbi:class I SAM-dependent methyltransferase [Miltoncostaea marina]|uniref:class I SAM-dependent methyltransferase n=1 Tax=Miltoncostaea marina TaxID=2843215 RepID=UPI001C3DAE62|nr:class I SAM-dependent methyltransferase [Miltoncostaea marina]
MATIAPTHSSEALAERLFGALVASMELACVHVGHRAGLYAALDAGPATSAELARRAGADERYVREWLEQQAVAGVIEADGGDDPAARRYALPAGHREALLERDSLRYAGAMAQLGVGVLAPIDRLVEAFRTGEGVPYADYGADTRDGIAAFNRPMFVNQLAQEWIPAIPDVQERLTAGAAPRVADVACGGGWSSVALAAGYPRVRVDGFDSDAPSVDAARRLADARGVADRVRFFVQDASDDGIGGEYDLVTIFEALHDMAHPVEALRTARGLLAPGGAVLVADERVAESFGAPGDEIERLNYGFSVLHCLAVGREDDHAACTGTVIRPHVVEGYAREAGFGTVEVAPVEHDFWRFYVLRP